MNSTYLIGLHLSKFNFELSKAEAKLCFKAYFKTEEFLCFDNILVLKVEGDSSQIITCLNRLAFTKEAFVISNKINWTDHLVELANNFNLVNGKDSCFKIYLPQKTDEAIKD